MNIFLCFWIFDQFISVFIVHILEAKISSLYNTDLCDWKITGPEVAHHFIHTTWNKDFLLSPGTNNVINNIMFDQVSY